MSDLTALPPARFVGDDQVISSWFDGTVRLFALSDTPYRPDRSADFGTSRLSGWEA